MNFPIDISISGNATRIITADDRHNILGLCGRYDGTVPGFRSTQVPVEHQTARELAQLIVGGVPADKVSLHWAAQARKFNHLGDNPLWVHFRYSRNELLVVVHNQTPAKGTLPNVVWLSGMLETMVQKAVVEWCKARNLPLAVFQQTAATMALNAAQERIELEGLDLPTGVAKTAPVITPEAKPKATPPPTVPPIADNKMRVQIKRKQPAQTQAASPSHDM
jgi:hypothetical protein